VSNHLYFGVVSGTLRRYNTGVHRKEPLTAAVVAPACCQRKLSVCPVFDWWWQKTKLNNAAAAAVVRRRQVETSGGNFALDVLRACVGRSLPTAKCSPAD